MKKQIVVILCSFYLTACSSFIEKKTTAIAENLSNSMLNFEDPKTVETAMPTFIIFIDSIARGKNASGASKMAAAQIIGAYSGTFVKSAQRQQRLSRLAFTYAQEGSCLIDKKWCGITDFNHQAFDRFAKGLTASDVPLAYGFAVAWLGYINSHSDDWNAIANLQRTKTLLEVVVKYDESYQHASAHLYLGAIASAIPKALGGKPEIAKAHFEKAILLSKNRNLLAKVEYARRYARSTFNKSLHHKLLTEVIEAKPEAPGLTLMNVWAQEQAALLLDSENTYFD